MNKMLSKISAFIILLCITVTYLSCRADEKLCVSLKIEYSEDMDAGIKDIRGENISKEWLYTIKICENQHGSISVQNPGTYFIKIDG